MFGRERIVTAAYSCLLEQKWHTFPIEPVRFHFSWPVISYQEYARLSDVSPVVFLEYGYDGFSVAGLSRHTAQYKRAAFTRPPICHPLDQQIEALFFPEICRFVSAAQSSFDELEEQYLGYNR